MKTKARIIEEGILLVLLLASLTGLLYKFLLIHPRTNADYVNEHHCVKAIWLPPSPPVMVVTAGEVQYVGAHPTGTTGYACPDLPADVKVWIDDDEAQPEGAK
jgi:hypothetical protein